MNIKYNSITATVDIKDSLKSHFFIMKTLLIVTFINVILNLSNPQVVFGFMKLIWLVLGMVAAVGLHQYFFKKTATDKIPLNQIIGIKERVLFGKKKYFLELKNGKKRDLLEVQSASDSKLVALMLIENKK